MRNHVSKWCLLRRQITKQTPSAVQSGSYCLQPPSPSCVRLWQKPTIVKRATGLKWHFGNPAVLLTGCCGGHYPEGTTLCSKGRHYTLPCALSGIIYILHRCCPSAKQSLSGVSTTVPLYSVPLGSSSLVFVSSLVLCTVWI